MTEDHLAICDVLCQFAEALDSRDFALYRSIMTHEIEVDYSSWRPDEPARTVPADDWVARGRMSMTGLQATMHTLTNMRTFIDGDSAVATCYVTAEHFLHNDSGDSAFVIKGYYRDGLVRTEDGWKLCAINLNVRWMSGNKALMDIAKARARELLGQS